MLLMLLLINISVFSQTNQPIYGNYERPSYPDRYSARVAYFDSLNNALGNAKRTADSLENLNITQQGRLDSIHEANANMEKELSELKKDLTGEKGANLQSSHTNSVLFIFNVIIGIILLIALIWMFGRKKSESSRSSASASSHYSNNNGSEGYDHKLERIEKLGNLRDKGLLTEDEFNFQKKQILSDKG